MAIKNERHYGAYISDLPGQETRENTATNKRCFGDPYDVMPPI